MSAEEPQLSGDSGPAPDEDFLEADQEASTEVASDAPTEEYDTEEEAPEEVRRVAVFRSVLPGAPDTPIALLIALLQCHI